MKIWMNTADSAHISLSLVWGLPLTLEKLSAVGTTCSALVFQEPSIYSKCTLHGPLRTMCNLSKKRRENLANLSKGFPYSAIKSAPRSRQGWPIETSWQAGEFFGWRKEFQRLFHGNGLFMPFESIFCIAKWPLQHILRTGAAKM